MENLEKFYINGRWVTPNSTETMPVSNPATEQKILEGISLDLGVEDRDFCKRLVDWADIIRKTFYDGGIDEIISTRRLVHIIRAFSIFKDKAKAIQVCVSRFDDETKQSFLELYDKVDADFQMPVPEVISNPGTDVNPL